MLQQQAFANYQLQAPLGANAYSFRYVAVGPAQTRVELRVPSDRLLQSSDWEVIKKRLKLVGMLQHPSIQRILHCELSHEPPFVVLELRQGRSLGEEHRLSPLTWRAAVQLGHHLATGLAAAHRLGVVAGNIDLSTIVARSAGDWTLDLTGMARGSRAFAAPEVLSGGHPEPASDVYSLAAVLESLLPVPDSVDQGVPETLAPFLRDCRQDDPTTRPSTGQLADLLLQLTAPDPQAVSNEFSRTLDAEGHPTTPPRRAITLGSVAVPRQLGRFELQDKLGEGAMGTVYRARDIADGTTVAIKVLNSQYVGNPKSRLRFAKEARLLARANNPFVANLLEFNTDNEVHFLAIEYVAGGTVARLLQEQGRLSEATALALILDVARGLSIAHQRGIIHRDIKPDNVLLTNIGHEFVTTNGAAKLPAEMTSLGGPLVKLSDFGLARNEQSDSMALTLDGSILGTPWYMSPEQCRGKIADARSDVYALGGTLFHLLAGKPPFEGETHMSVIHQQCHESPPVLQQLLPVLSEATSRIVEKCLAKNPDARYADAIELTADIEQVLKGEPTSMRLHPATPETGGAQVLEFRFSCDLSASPAQLWPYVSNTDRINNSLGLPAVTYSTRVHPERGVERFAETRLAGQRIAWQEHPYEWNEGRRMSVLREFTTGPFLWFVNVIEMVPQVDGGTRLTQTLKILPRNWLGRLLGNWELGRKSPKAFTRAYERIDQYLSQPTRQDPSADPFHHHSTLSRPQRSRFRQRLERLREQRLEPTVIETLGQFLEHAPDQEVARIRPLVFAERFGLDADRVVEACLLGAREGLLTLLWDILCPSCRIPADVQETLADLKSHGYCPACDLKYEIDFANSIELIFRAHPELRTIETRTYCIGGPAFSAHVVAQTRLGIGERLALELDLGEGAYRIRGPQLPFAVDFSVAFQGVERRWELSLLRPPAPDTIPRLQTGSQVITLVNNTPRELQVRLERTAGREQALTAAAASSMALFREIFPNQTLSAGQIVSVTTVTLLQAEMISAVDLYEQLGDGPAFERIRQTLDRIDQTVRQEGGAVVKIVGEGVVASFVNPFAAAKAGVALLQQTTAGTSPLRIAIHRGPALVTTLNDRLDYFGTTAHLLRELLAQAGPGELLLTANVGTQPEVAQLLEEEKLKIDIPPLRIGTNRTIIQRCRVP